MEPWNPDYVPLMEAQQAAIQTAFAAAIELTGCVECARVSCIEYLLSAAEGKRVEIAGGDDWLNENAAKPEPQEAPTERNGVRTTCNACQEPPPAGTVVFYRRGVDYI